MTEEGKAEQVEGLLATPNLADALESEQFRRFLDQVPIAIVAAWAGHADGGATALKHYIRTRPGDLDAARDAIAELLGA